MFIWNIFFVIKCYRILMTRIDVKDWEIYRINSKKIYGIFDGNDKMPCF